MQPRSALVSVGDAGRRETTSRDRRHFRHGVTSLAYVRVDHANGGIIRNLSESGLAIQAVGRLHPNQVVHLRFELLKPKIRIDATGEVVWADVSGQAGVRFVDLPVRAQHQLRDWILTDLLAIASQFGPNRSPIFSNAVEGERADGLLVSSGAVPSIQVAEADGVIVSGVPDRAEMPVRLSWWPADIYPHTLARFVDSVVVISAVLLFAVIATEATGVFPSWFVAVPIGMGLVLIFGVVYYALFKYLAGATLGSYLARLAAEDTRWIEARDEGGPRFR